MGGDGGVVATNRRYMRGAGVADHTGDSTRYSNREKAQAERDGTLERMSTCALTGQTLNYKEEIVTCPHGCLYGKVAALDALLKRMDGGESGDGGDGGKLGDHIRGRKDLVPVYFETLTKTIEGEEVVVPVCPITGMELTGLQPAHVLVKSKHKKDKASKDTEEEEKHPNVLSEKALNQMGIQALQDDYGPFNKEDMIRLIPPSSILPEIQTKWQARIQAEMAKKKKKRKKIKGESKVKAITNGDAKVEMIKKRRTSTTTEASVVGEAKSIQDVRTKVAAAVASNSVLSDLFSTASHVKTEGERKDNLFAR